MWRQTIDWGGAVGLKSIRQNIGRARVREYYNKNKAHSNPKLKSSNKSRSIELYLFECIPLFSLYFSMHSVYRPRVSLFIALSLSLSPSQSVRLVWYRFCVRRRNENGIRDCLSNANRANSFESIEMESLSQNNNQFQWDSVLMSSLYYIVCALHLKQQQPNEPNNNKNKQIHFMNNNHNQ